jgi:hypothetical protein
MQSNFDRRRRTLSVVIAFLTVVYCLSFSAMAADPAPEVAPGVGLHMDPAKVVGEAKCAECHKAENAAWQHTHHFATFVALPKNPKATEITTALGLQGGIRRNGLCLNCHFTVAERDGATSPVSGVSCESCHGAAKGWLTIHNDYGAGKTRDTETAEHKEKRHADADAAGMIRKDRVNLIAANCFSCHTVPNEDLVTKGGHTAGSDFELVSWSQGEVRHNYLLDQTKNAALTTAQKRVLYVAGQMTDLEYSLRGAQQITKVGAYRDAMLARVHAATGKVDEILKADKIAEIDAVISTVVRAANGQFQLSKAVLAELPDKLAAATDAFVKANDGSKLDAIDSLIPKEVKGTPSP